VKGRAVNAIREGVIDGRLIHDHQFWIEEPPSGGFLFLNIVKPRSA